MDMLLPWRYQFAWINVTARAFPGSVGREPVRVSAEADLVAWGGTCVVRPRRTRARWPTPFRTTAPHRSPSSPTTDPHRQMEDVLDRLM
ncbi:hypothetical protein ACIPJK_31765 [Streptomyces roseus]|uniref:hypothetical protein n=1 Tax=Streptomyces roseus TaxID=66430 RepID=UPI003823BABD